MNESTRGSSRRKKHPLPFWIGVCVWAVVAVGTASAIWPAREDGSVATYRTTSFRPRAVPVDVVRLDALPISDEEWRTLTAPLSYGRKKNDLPTVSGCLHLLRLHGLDATFAPGTLGCSSGLLRVVTDTAASEQIFGQRAIVRTRYGARYRVQAPMWRLNDGSNESHPNQNVASLGELGLPLSTRLHIDGNPASLRDVLCDLIANFDLEARELEWTALSLGLFLPPTRRWRNRYDVESSFDDVVNKLMNTGFDRGSCGGTHVLYTLIMFMRIDEAVPILSDAVRAALHAFVERIVTTALAHQEPDGSWGWKWRSAKDGGDSVTITGHLMECFLRLPPEYLPPTPRLIAAGRWLKEALRHKDRDDPDLEGRCPYTHAAVVVSQLRQRSVP